MVARLTPDQKVACSIHVGFNTSCSALFNPDTKRQTTLFGIFGINIQLYLQTRLWQQEKIKIKKNLNLFFVNYFCL
jgi:hypothetical protein